MSKFKEKTFLEALSYIRKDIEKLKAYLSDNRLTRAEKQIVEGWILLQGNYFPQAIELLEKIAKQESPVIESQRLLILGITYNNKSEFDKGIAFIQQSIRILQKIQDDYFLFVAYDNFFITAYNLRDKTSMIKAIRLLRDHPQKSKQQLVSLHKALFLFHAQQEEIDQAQDQIVILHTLIDSMSASQYISYLIGCYDFYVKCDLYLKAESVLKKLSKLRKFNHGANYKFMKGLLDFVAHDKQPYLYLDHFKDHPSLYYQVKVLLALVAQDEESAMCAWKKLNEVSPNIYCRDFQYNGEKNIFAISLKKILASPTKKSINLDLSKLSDIEKTILENLMSGPVAKEELYRICYHRQIESKADLLKLAKHISRLRLNHHVAIKSRKGTYYVDTVAMDMAG